MFRLYLQQALFHLRENPIITWVSIIGTALSICMIMVIVITLQVRIIDCEPEVNRSRSLYVSTMSVKAKGADDGQSANSYMSIKTGRECFRSLTTAEAVTLVSLISQVRVSLPAGNVQTTADMRQTDETFWSIYRFRFLSGKPFTKADSDAGLTRVVLAESVARRLFGTTDVVGKAVQLNRVEYIVTGVVADVSVLAKYAYGQVWVPYNSTDIESMAWQEGVMGQLSAVILAHSSDDFPAIRQEVEQKRLQYNASLRDVEIFYRGQPDEQFTTLYRKWYQEPDMGAVVRRYLMVIAILLIVPAVNLSSMTLSRMRKRMAEIGVRKAFGATGNELIRQVFFENLVLTLIAGIVGLALSYAATFLLNGFLFNNSDNIDLSGDTSLTVGMLLSPWVFLAAFGFCLLMNLLSAGLPAWRASRMNIVEAINQKE
ncbi:MAG: ABC transporter permease [Bacteroides sp.]|nr:ABC transporter permease [Bacteroides sp.]